MRVYKCFGKLNFSVVILKTNSERFKYSTNLVILLELQKLIKSNLHRGNGRKLPKASIRFKSLVSYKKG